MPQPNAQNTLTRLEYLRRAYNRASDDLGRLLANAQYRNAVSVEFFQLNRELSRQVDEILLILNKRTLDNINRGTAKAWSLSNANNDRLVTEYIKGIAVSSSTAKLAGFYQLNSAALDAFSMRNINGLGLSERVWAYVSMSKEVLEEYMGSGVALGKSAASISQDVRLALKEPNKLFRRVRDKDGNLVLSKNAKAYHPGRGVYRSSYKNALRLTQSETNMAYRQSDYMRRKQLPFVVGVTVKLSNGHPRPDICDAMKGDYPKGFRFLGWHPKCICYTTAKLLDKDKFKTYLKTGNVGEANYQTTLPNKAWGWIYSNKERVKGWKNTPYFLRDNFTKDFHLKKSVLNVKE